MSVLVSPASTAVPAGGTASFSAAVEGSADPRVTWSIREGSPAGGSVSASRTYIAPSTAGTFHVIATSDADRLAAGAATVTVLPPAPVLAGAPAVYPGSRTQSPLDDSMVRRLQAIAALGPALDAHNFMKVGDSITASNPFLTCFDGGGDGIPNFSGNANMSIALGGRSYLAPTVVHYRTNLVGGETMFGRVSLAAQSGADASFPLGGSRLQQEIDAVHPRYAVVMFGSNDVARPVGQGDLATNIVPYEENLRAIVDALLARGVIPILSTMPPRTDSATFPLLVPAFNGVVRAIAQGRQIPLVDYNRELMGLPKPLGLSGDGIHPSVQDWNSACWFTQADLAYGYNVRNLVTIEALHRMKAVLVDASAAPDPGAMHLAGDGTAAAPFQVPSLPFGDLRAAAAGMKLTYRVMLGVRTALRVVVLDAGANAVSASVVPAGSPSKDAARIVAATLDAGAWDVVVSAAAAAEFTVSMAECAPGDASCAN